MIKTILLTGATDGISLEGTIYYFDGRKSDKLKNAKAVTKHILKTI